MLIGKPYYCDLAYIPVKAKCFSFIYLILPKKGVLTLAYDFITQMGYK